jgi:hypothetical protein
LPENVGKTVTVTGPVVAVNPGWKTHLLVSLGETPEKGGFDIEIYDPTLFPEKDLDGFIKGWTGKNIAATGKIEVGQMAANKGKLIFNILEPSQVKITAK